MYYFNLYNLYMYKKNLLLKRRYQINNFLNRFYSHNHSLPTKQTFLKNVSLKKIVQTKIMLFAVYVDNLENNSNFKRYLPSSVLTQFIFFYSFKKSSANLQYLSEYYKIMLSLKNTTKQLYLLFFTKYFFFLFKFLVTFKRAVLTVIIIISN